jgi:hypothetical protein
MRIEIQNDFLIDHNFYIINSETSRDILSFWDTSRGYYPTLSDYKDSRVLELIALCFNTNIIGNMRE